MKKLILFLPLFALFLGCSPKVEPDYTDDFVGTWKKENVLTYTAIEYISHTHTYSIAKVSNSEIVLTGNVLRKYNFIDGRTGPTSLKWNYDYSINIKLDNAEKFSLNTDKLPVKFTDTNGISNTQLMPVALFFSKSGSNLKLIASMKHLTFDLGGDYVLSK